MIPRGIVVVAVTGIATIIGTLAALNWDKVSGGLEWFGKAMTTLGGIGFDAIAAGIKGIADGLSWLKDKIGEFFHGLFNKTSFDGGGFGSGGLFHNASFGGGGSGGGNPMPDYGSLNASQKEVVDYIKASAVARGIDPDIAVRVAASEGLNGYVGDHGTSFGPFQLHRGGAGSVGTEFEKHTGLNLQNRGTWKSQVDYALSTAAKQGWSAWHGWHGHPRAGLGGAHSRPVPPHSRPATPVHIENVMVLDGKEIARNTTKHIVNASTHPTTGPYFDSSRHWAPPDMGTIGV